MSQEEVQEEIQIVSKKSFRNKSARAWCYTLNNYTDRHIETLANIGCVRHACGREIAPTTGTPHLQGYIRFASPCRASFLMLRLPGIHLEVRRGTETEAATYALKEGSVVFDIGHNFDEQKEYHNKDEEAAAVIQEIEDGELYGQIRSRHKLHVYWHRRNVIDYIQDEKRLKIDHGFDGI